MSVFYYRENERKFVAGNHNQTIIKIKEKYVIQVGLFSLLDIFPFYYSKKRKRVVLLARKCSS